MSIPELPPRIFLTAKCPTKTAVCNTSDTCLISDYALKTLLYIGGTSSTTCGTNYELEDNAGCTRSGTREQAYNTCSMINNNNKLESVQSVHM